MVSSMSCQFLHNIVTRTQHSSHSPHSMAISYDSCDGERERSSRELVRVLSPAQLKFHDGKIKLHNLIKAIHTASTATLLCFVRWLSLRAVQFYWFEYFPFSSSSTSLSLTSPLLFPSSLAGISILFSREVLFNWPQSSAQTNDEESQEDGKKEEKKREKNIKTWLYDS